MLCARPVPGLQRRGGWRRNAKPPRWSKKPRLAASRDFASNKLNKPANIGMVTKVLRKMEGSVQACPGHALQGDHGLAVRDLEKATSFARTYAQVSRQVRASKQDRAVKRELAEKRRLPCAGCAGSREGCCGPFTETELTRSCGSCETRKPRT